MSAVMRYTKQTTDLMLAARELDVEVLVDGSIQKFGQRLRVSVQAWNVSDGSCRLSTKYDAAVSEIFELQDRIADGLACELNLSPSPQIAGSPATKNAEAYELFPRAVERMRRD